MNWKKKFPNGFTSWYETFFEVASFISENNNHEDSVICKTQFLSGHGGLYELAEDWTDEFEVANKNREWDGEFFDELELFMHNKNSITTNTNTNAKH